MKRKNNILEYFLNPYVDKKTVEKARKELKNLKVIK